MNATSKTLDVEANGDLEVEVLAWINERAEDYDSGPRGVLEDLAHGGCSSGMVGYLIPTVACVKFYAKHQREIDRMLYELLDDCGCRADELFERSGWDKKDPFAREDMNQNILAWFGFEETARNLGQRGGIEL